MVNCNKCNKQITDPKDINVVALFGIKPTTMCNNCYASRERGITRHLFYYPKWFPINSTPFIILLVIATIVFLGIIIAILLGQGGTATINGKPTELSFGVRLMIVFLLLIVLVWQWILWFISRSFVSRIKFSH